MKRTLIIVAVIFIILLGVTKKKEIVNSGWPMIPSSPPSSSISPAVSSPTSSLKSLAEKRGLEIGNVVISTSDLTNEHYAPILTREFGLLVVGGSFFNWSFHPPARYLRPSKDTFDFTDADRVVDFAQTHNMKIQPHHLAWGNEEVLPTWLKNGNFSKEELLSILENHIKTVVGRYKARIDQWSVINEVHSRNYLGGAIPGDNFWYKKLGDEYLLKSFRWAREADPNAKLIINDFGNETINPVSISMYNAVKKLKAAGAPIDVVGMQMHLDGSKPPNKQKVIAAMKYFGDLGVDVYVSEFDVDMSKASGTKEEKYQKQAQIYKDMVEACLESGVCKSFSIFGITDKLSWLNLLGKRRTDPLPFDDNYNPKPSYYAIADALK